MQFNKYTHTHTLLTVAATLSLSSFVSCLREVFDVLSSPSPPCKTWIYIFDRHIYIFDRHIYIFDRHILNIFDRHIYIFDRHILNIFDRHIILIMCFSRELLSIL